MELEIVYVTVGTTKFDALICDVLSDRVLRILQKRGCRQLILQVGSGRKIPTLDTVQVVRSRYGIAVEHYDFKVEPTRTDIARANLTIGHAGAGTCIDILRHRRPGLIVINDKLMGNHQAELALQLSKDRYVFCCTVPKLAERLETLDLNAWRPYPYGEARKNMQTFVARLDQLMSS